MLRCGSFWVFYSFHCSFRSFAGPLVHFRFTRRPIRDDQTPTRCLISLRLSILEQLYHLCPCPVFPGQRSFTSFVYCVLQIPTLQERIVDDHFDYLTVPRRNVDLENRVGYKLKVLEWAEPKFTNSGLALLPMGGPWQGLPQLSSSFFPEN
jgi:hypothetical protein